MPIDQVLRGLALRIDTSVDPETQPLLEYSFIEDNTQRVLARIRGTPQPDGGGQLAFETNAGADTTTPRMLIDHQGNVGIGTENPAFRLDVVGDAKFSGPLTVQGALRVDGGAQIGGDLDVPSKGRFSGPLVPGTGDDRAAKISGDLSVTGKVTATILRATPQD